jgi:hypothetical protein
MDNVCNLARTELKTVDIYKSINEFAEENDISFSDIDFNIVKIDFYEKIFSKDSNYELSPVKFKYDTCFENRIIQKYSIKLKQGKKSYFRKCSSLKYFNDNLKVVLKVNNYSYKNADDNSKDLRSIFMDINKIKAENNILIKVFSQSLSDDISKFIEYAKSVDIVNDYSIVIFDSKNYIKEHKGYELVYYFEDEQKSFLNCVDVGERLLSYKQAQKGINGITAFGEIIEAEYSGLKNTCQYCERDVVIVKDSTVFSIFSKKSGFVIFHNNKLVVKQTLQTKSLIGKKYNISLPLKQGITIKVSSTEDNNIALKNVDLKLKNIVINGNIDSNVKIEAIKIIHNGSSSQDTTVESKVLHSDFFCGKFKGKNLDANSCDGADIVADIVNIKKFKNGKLKAKQINIKNLDSGAKIFIEEELHIHRVNGNNIFYININSDDKEKIIKNNQLIEKINLDLEVKNKSLVQLNNFIMNNEDNIDNIKNYIEESKDNNKTFSLNLIEKVQEFDKKIRLKDKLDKHINIWINKKIQLTNENKDLSNSFPDIKIFCDNGWCGNSEFSQKLVINIGSKKYIYILDATVPNRLDSTYIKNQIISRSRFEVK